MGPTASSELREPVAERGADHPVADALPAVDTMTRLDPRRAKKLLMTADAVAAFTGLFVAFALQFLLGPVPQSIVLQQLLLCAASIPFFLFGAGLNRLHQARANERSGEEVRNVLNAVMMGIAGLVTLSFVIQKNSGESHHVV